MDLFGGIEAGGTKFVCAIASGPENILAEQRFATTIPEETLPAVAGFFQDFMKRESRPLRALGIGSFGPIDINPESPTVGFITSTPKPGWAQTNMAGFLRDALQIPVVMDTDVNAAALGEGLWGAAQGLRHFVYLTIGTGIGGGVIVDGQPVHGLIHPEIGHLLLPHDLNLDPFPGSCPFHGDCFEGLASGPALLARWGIPGQELPTNHPAWELESTYIAQALHSLVCTLSPNRIILGGGVMQRAELFPSIREKVVRSLNGYVQSPVLLDDSQHYIVPPSLGGRSGVLGAIALGKMATSSF